MSGADAGGGGDRSAGLPAPTQLAPSEGSVAKETAAVSVVAVTASASPFTPSYDSSADSSHSLSRPVCPQRSDRRRVTAPSILQKMLPARCHEGSRASKDSGACIGTQADMQQAKIQENIATSSQQSATKDFTRVIPHELHTDVPRTGLSSAGLLSGSSSANLNESRCLLEAGLRNVRANQRHRISVVDSEEGYKKGHRQSQSTCTSAATPRRFSQLTDELGGSDEKHPNSFSHDVDPRELSHDDPIPEELWQVPQLVFALVLGAVVGLATVILHFATAKIEEGHRLAARKAADQFHRGYSDGIFATCMTLGTTLAAFAVSWISCKMVPECVAGGTIATKICLAVGAPVPFRIGLWRFMLSSIYVGMGNALGIESPTLHLSAAVASMLHHGALAMSERTTKCLGQRSQLFTSEGVPQAVVLGCAAGLSAAFGAPLAAISYAVEEYVDVRQTGTVTALVLLSAISALLVRRCCENLFGAAAISVTIDFGSSGLSDPASGAQPLMMPWLAASIVIGIAMGVLSPLSMKVALKLRHFSNNRRSVGQEIMLCGLSGLFTGLVGCGIFLLTGCETGWGLGQLGIRTQLNDSCSSGQESGSNHVRAILLLGFGKLLAFIACFSTGGAGGILMPSLLIGSLLGRCIGLSLESMDPSLSHGGMLLGMVALFSANMRLPLTAATVVIEYSSASNANHGTLLACTIPLASAISAWTAAWWDPMSVFDRMMLQDGIDPETLSQQIQIMIHGYDVASPVLGPLGRRQSIASRDSMDVANYQLEEMSTAARMVDAAKRRSILLWDMGLESRSTQGSHSESIFSSHSPSFLSSPDELLFASPRGARLLGRRQQRLALAAAIPNIVPQSNLIGHGHGASRRESCENDGALTVILDDDASNLPSNLPSRSPSGVSGVNSRIRSLGSHLSLPPSRSRVPSMLQAWEGQGAHPRLLASKHVQRKLPAVEKRSASIVSLR